MQAAADSFTAETGIPVKINTVDHGTFQDQISSYLQGTPDDVWTWFSGFRMRFFAEQGLATDISDVWAKIEPMYGEAFKVGSTGNDGKQYFIPIYPIRGRSSTARAFRRRRATRSRRPSTSSRRSPRRSRRTA